MFILASVTCYGANPSFQSFPGPQFSSDGRTIRIISLDGSLLNDGTVNSNKFDSSTIALLGGNASAVTNGYPWGVLYDTNGAAIAAVVAFGPTATNIAAYQAFIATNNLHFIQTNISWTAITNLASAQMPFGVITNAPWLTSAPVQTNIGWAGVTNLQSAQLPASVITNQGAIVAGFVSGTITNGTSGNASTATLAIFVSGTLSNSITGNAATATTSTYATSNPLTNTAANITGANALPAADGNALTNLNSANLVGTIPIGLVATGVSAVAGPFITSNSVARSYSYNGNGLTNLNGANVVGAVPSATSATSASSVSGGSTNQVYAFGASAGWQGNPQVTNLTLVGTNIAIGSIGPTLFQIMLDASRVPTVPVATFRPITDQSAMVVDMMPRDSTGASLAAPTNQLSTAITWMDLVDRDLSAAPNKNDWGVLRLANTGNGATVGHFASGTNTQKTLTLVGAGVSIATGAFPGTLRESQNGSAHYFGNNATWKTVINNSDGSIGVGTISPASGSLLDVAGKVTVATTLTATNGVILPNTATAPNLAQGGAMLWSDGTNLCVIIKNGGGILTTNKVTMTSWP